MDQDWGLMDMVRVHLHRAEQALGHGLFFFGDSAFPEQEHLLRMYREPMTEEKRYVNKVMSGTRISVEWGFGIVDGKWKRLLWEDNNRIRCTRPGMMYLLAVFLTNVHNCMEPNEIRKAFDGKCPSAAEYIEWTMVEAAEVAAALSA
jgi:hypothetical protein